MKYKILFNRKKAWAKKLAKEVNLFLSEAGFRKDKKADFTIIIGGDGTIFYHKQKIEGKLIAIGSEKSYVCQLNRLNWKKHLLEFIESDKVINLPLLNVKMGKKKVGYAINDVVIHSSDCKTISIGVYYKNEFMYFEGDGLIIATPLGSTGYSFSAGGPSLSLDVNALVITPISPVRRTAFPVVVPKTNIKATYSNGKGVLVLDGQKEFYLKQEVIVEVEVAKKTIRFAVRS